MKKWLKGVCAAVCAVIVLLLAGFLALQIDYRIGVAKGNIEKDARSSRIIDDSWLVAADTSDTMAAMLFYADDLSDYTYTIYVNRPGLSFGYFLRLAGSTVDIDDGRTGVIAEFNIEGVNERAFISTNKLQVSRAEIDDGNTARIIEIDSQKPFAIVLPVDAGSVVFYDINGNNVDSFALKD